MENIRDRQTVTPEGARRETRGIEGVVVRHVAPQEDERGLRFV